MQSTNLRCVRAALAALAAIAAAGCQTLLPGGPAAPDAAGEAPAAALPVPDAGLPAESFVRAARPVLELEPLPEPPDLLGRLRAGFVLPKSEDRTVQQQLAWYASHPEYLDRVFTRGERYLHHIVETLEARGMPADLALLPVVESAFDPFAYSHGRASGLWQIIPGTGRMLDLEQDWWFDARRDVLESTRGALDYLEQLHSEFDDWLLAVAGYNSGGGNVRRAVRRAEAAGRETDFWGIQPYLPRETRGYVPRLLAIRDLVADPQAHGVTLRELPDEPYFAAVETQAQIDMALAAELAGIDVDDLYALNPGVNRWATDPDGPHRLLVPRERADAFAEALAALGQRERVQWTRHRVRPGETLSHLALKYRTTPAALREINGLRGNVIRAGAHLMIPHALASHATYSSSVDARVARTVGRERNGNRHVHVVAPGESLWTISRRYGVDVRALASWNAMAPRDVLSVGRELVVWTRAPANAVGGTRAAVAGGAGGTATGTAVARAAAFDAPADGRIRRVNYVVRRGDSLSSIAQRFRVTVRKLLEWNDLSVERYLQPGQRLTMYVDVTKQST